ncbi:hypothetical protein MMC08_003979 [Hypocenomyce scalaris]|nr:hypothetical protein [Hypocenomyce scalaris]
MLALFNLPGIFSCIAFGMLGDGISLFGGNSLTPFTITFLSAIGSALSVFLLWGLAARSGVAGLALFSAIYGFFAGAYSATWGGVLKEIEREAVSHNEAVNTGVVYSLLNGGRGLGFVVGGVAGVELLKSGAVQHSSNWGYGTEYGSVILYTGVSAVIGEHGKLQLDDNEKLAEKEVNISLLCIMKMSLKLSFSSINTEALANR